MPNWCDNYLVVSHPDQTKVSNLITALSAEEPALLQHLRPSQGDWDNQWSIENWGTKWEAEGVEFEENNNEVIINFSTAWSPPVSLYEYMVQNGWSVNAMYNEYGNAFCGSFDNENGDQYFDYGDSDIPDSIKEYACLDENGDYSLDDEFEDEND